MRTKHESVKTGSVLSVTMYFSGRPNDRLIESFREVGIEKERILR